MRRVKKSRRDDEGEIIMWKTVKGKADVSRSGRGEPTSLRKDEEGQEVERKRPTADNEEKHEAAESKPVQHQESPQTFKTRCVSLGRPAEKSLI